MKQNLKNILFVTSLFFAQSSLASILDLSGNDKGLYTNVEIKKNADSEDYTATVTRATLGGPTITIYEGSVVKEVLQNGVQYRDARLRVVDQGNGKASLKLNNGEHIQIELGE